MRYLWLLVVLFTASFIFAQKSSTYYVISDQVNLRFGATTSSQIFETAEFGRTFQSPVIATADWLGFYSETLDDTLFINRKFTGLESDFLRIINDKKSVSGRGKFELLKIKLRNDDYNGSQDLLLDLLNNHREFLNMIDESCDQLNVLALEMYFGGYPKPKQAELLKKIIGEVKDKNIKAMASYIALRYSILNEQVLLSEFYIKKIINGELPNLILEGCDYSVYFSVHPLIEAKKVIASYFLYVDRERRDIITEFIRSNISEKTNLKSDFCKDLLKVINDENYETHYEYVPK